MTGSFRVLTVLSLAPEKEPLRADDRRLAEPLTVICQTCRLVQRRLFQYQRTVLMVVLFLFATLHVVYNAIFSLFRSELRMKVPDFSGRLKILLCLSKRQGILNKWWTFALSLDRACHI